MTDLIADTDTRSDAELISAVRAGDSSAYGVLFERHRSAAQRMAAQLVRGPDIDDLVSEAFTKVLVLMQAGSGPDLAFRAYLLTAIRRLHVDRIRATSRIKPTDDLDELDSGVEFADPAVAQFEHGATAAAFGSLPERWQMVLWHLDVEGAKPAEIAPLLGMSPNSVSALAYRAREGLRQAYLQNHLADTADENCRWTTDHLGAYVRKGLAKRERQKVDEHLEGCRRCTAVYLELVEVNSNLAGVLAPVLLGGAASGYLAMGASKAAIFGLPWIGPIAGKAKNWAAGNTLQAGLVAAASVAVAGAAAGAIYLAATNGANSPQARDSGPGPVSTAPAETVSPASPGPSSSPGAPSSSPGPSVPSASNPAVNPAVPPDVTNPNNPGASPPGDTQGDQPGQADQPSNADESSDPVDNSTTEPTDNPPTTVAPPSAPTHVQATDGDDGVEISWEAAEGATGYKVYRAEDSTPDAQPLARVANESDDPISGKDPITETNFTDPSPLYGKSSTYSVVAVGEGGESAMASKSIDLPPAGMITATNPDHASPNERCLVAAANAQITLTMYGACADGSIWKAFDDGTIRAAGELCLTVGTPIKTPTMEYFKAEAQSCTVPSDDDYSGKHAKQQWDFNSSQSAEQAISSRSQPGYVLDVNGGSGGNEIIIYPAKAIGYGNQRFGYRSVPSK